MFRTALVRKALAVARSAHEGQTRKNGEPVLAHAVQTVRPARPAPRRAQPLRGFQTQRAATRFDPNAQPPGAHSARRSS